MHAPSATETKSVSVQTPIVILAALLIPALVVAFSILYLLPEDLAAVSFAWPVRPRMTSLMLGATYLGGAYFFLVVLLSRQWRHVRLGLLPVTAFAATLGLATLLHWDRFMPGHPAFLIWAFLYFTVPFILPLLWLRNERRARAAAMQREGELPQWSRWAFGVLGAILVVASLLLFLFPAFMIDLWPWTLTALTARVMAAMYILPGHVGLSIADDGSWSSARFLLQAQAFSIILMLVAVYVARADFAWDQPTSWLFVGGLSLILLLAVLTYLSPKRLR